MKLPISGSYAFIIALVGCLLSVSSFLTTSCGSTQMSSSTPKNSPKKELNKDAPIPEEREPEQRNPEPEEPEEPEDTAREKKPAKDDKNEVPKRCQKTYYGFNTCMLIAGFYRFKFTADSIEGGPVKLINGRTDCLTKFEFSKKDQDYYSFKNHKNNCAYPVPPLVSFKCEEDGNSVIHSASMGAFECKFEMVTKEAVEDAGATINTEILDKKSWWCKKFKCSF